MNSNHRVTAAPTSEAKPLALRKDERADGAEGGERMDMWAAILESSGKFVGVCHHDDIGMVLDRERRWLPQDGWNDKQEDKKGSNGIV